MVAYGVRCIKHHDGLLLGPCIAICRGHLIAEQDYLSQFGAVVCHLLANALGVVADHQAAQPVTVVEGIVLDLRYALGQDECFQHI